MDEVENQISDIKDKVAEDTQFKQQQEKRIQKNEDSIRSLWDNIKHNYICIMGVPVREKTEQEIKNLFQKIMTENFINLVKETDIQPQEVKSVSNKLNPKRTTARHVIIKMPKLKIKKRTLKAGRQSS